MRAQKRQPGGGHSHRVLRASRAPKNRRREEDLHHSSGPKWIMAQLLRAWMDVLGIWGLVETGEGVFSILVTWLSTAK